MRLARRILGDQLERFNPRLPLLGGDAGLAEMLTPPLVVSIHASRCWEAMRNWLLMLSAFLFVSIHASRCWEAMPEMHDNYPRHQ